MERMLPCLRVLMENSKEEVVKASNILMKICKNIRDNPEVDRYRSIQIGSSTFMNLILPVNGALECLYEMGFEERNDRYILPKGKGVEKVNSLLTQLEISVGSLDKSMKENDIPDTSKVSNSTDILKSESQVYQRVQSYLEHVLLYENTKIQSKARAVVPIKTLEERARKRLDKSPQLPAHGSQVNLNLQDCILLELLNWFKAEFFTWMNEPPCTCFNGKVMSRGVVEPTASERKWRAHTVESYVCTQCNNYIRFPRYNHPEKLLETRTGRCGEWANCFTLLCRALGFDARYVVDWTDHVWTEVYSETVKRWLHCDPCENVCDQPLLYEEGWGKKLFLIIAFSQEDLVDVTWRYTKNSQELLLRRKKLFRETWWRGTLTSLRQNQISNIVASRRAVIEERLVREMAESISPKIHRQNNLGGRTSGSVQWREARGELGNTNQFVISPKENEKRIGGIRLHYFTSMDKYTRDSNDEEILGWESVLYSKSNIERKEEHDWKMVYLARSQGCPTAHISWKIELNERSNKALNEKLVLDKLELTLNFKVFESGIVKWILCTDKSALLLSNGKNHLKEEVQGATGFSLHAFLSGGNGSCAWQHTQLFRQSFDDPEPQFQLFVTFKKQVQ